MVPQAGPRPPSSTLGHFWGASCYRPPMAGMPDCLVSLRHGFVTPGSPLSGMQATPPCVCPAQPPMQPLALLVITSAPCGQCYGGTIGLFDVQSSNIPQGNTRLRDLLKVT